MNFKPVFPTPIHKEAAELVRDFFSAIEHVDTVLVVNSCARGHATPVSDLDFAILVKPGTTMGEREAIETSWQNFAVGREVLDKYKLSSRFAQLHLNIIDGVYSPSILEPGGMIDYFEVEIGNQVCYSAAMGKAGDHFNSLRKKWLPYYDELLRMQRLAMVKEACDYDLEHISAFVARGLPFQAFDILIRAFQEYLQCLFIANKTYPIAYNKWIKYQVIDLLEMPDLYQKLPSILSVGNIETNEINDRVKMLRELLSQIE